MAYLQENSVPFNVAVFQTAAVTSYKKIVITEFCNKWIIKNTMSHNNLALNNEIFLVFTIIWNVSVYFGIPKARK